MADQKFNCPVCGYPKLDLRPYKNIPDNPYPLTVQPPYSAAWGVGSYEVCGCCGFEFGFDDDPGGPSPGTSFSDYLKEWFMSGQQWFDSKIKPENFDLIRQMEAARIPVPDYIKISRQLSGRTVRG